MYDMEEDGTVGSQPITATVTEYEDPDNFTCPVPRGQC